MKVFIFFKLKKLNVHYFTGKALAPLKMTDVFVCMFFN